MNIVSFMPSMPTLIFGWSDCPGIGLLICSPQEIDRESRMLLDGMIRAEFRPCSLSTVHHL